MISDMWRYVFNPWLHVEDLKEIHGTTSEVAPCPFCTGSSHTVSGLLVFVAEHGRSDGMSL